MRPKSVLVIYEAQPELLNLYQENEHLEEKVLSLSDLVTQLKESNAELKLQVENVQSKPIENLEEDSENKIKYAM